MKEIQLTQGKTALVDDDDYPMLSVYKRYVKKDKLTVYAGTNQYLSKEQRPHITMHSVIMGHPLNGMEIDHIDGNGLNNQKSNLRIVSHRQNCQNRHQKLRKSCKHPGIDWCKFHKKYRARILIDGKRIHLGLFKNEDDAFNAYTCAQENLGVSGLS